MSIRLWLHPAAVAEYVEGAAIRVRRGVRGHTRRTGTAAGIIRSCIADTWDGRSFTASPGHFHNFWTRDLCFSVPSLVRVGETERVLASLAYALSTWERRRSHVTTTIHRFDRPADVYDYGVDSLPLLMAALRSSGADDLVERHREWLAREVVHFSQRVVDPETGLVRADRKYSAHRDTVTNRSNAYGNTMVALLAKTLGECPEFELPDPLARHFDGDYGRLLRDRFWMGDRYRDAIGGDATSGEANLWPFYTGVESSFDMLSRALDTLEKEGYTSPLPLRYETQRDPTKEVWLTRHLLPDYQGSTVWTSLGAMFLQIQRTVDPSKAADGIAHYTELIERDGTYWEVLDPRDLRCWVSPRRVLIGEESMLWSAIFLDLLEHGDSEPALLSPPTDDRSDWSAELAA
jgi:hypothetical protein